MEFEFKGREISKRTNEIISKKLKFFIKEMLTIHSIKLEPYLYYKDAIKINNFTYNKNYYITEYHIRNKVVGYIILLKINDQNIILWENNENYVLIQLPYIFENVLYENITIFKALIDDQIVIIFDLYDISYNMSERISKLEEISNKVYFDRDNEFENVYELKFQKYTLASSYTSSLLDNILYIPNDPKHKTFYKMNNRI